MNRKDFLAKTVGLAGVAVASDLFAESKKPVKGSGSEGGEGSEEHSEHNHDESSESGSEGNLKKLIEVSNDCIAKGNICLDHCIDLIASDKSMAACAKSVREMLAACNTLITLASSKSKHLKKYASVCIDICGACFVECKKHSKKHSQCRDCGLSCKACIKELQKFV